MKYNNYYVQSGLRIHKLNEFHEIHTLNLVLIKTSIVLFLICEIRISNQEMKDPKMLQFLLSKLWNRHELADGRSATQTTTNLEYDSKREE